MKFFYNTLRAEINTQLHTCTVLTADTTRFGFKARYKNTTQIKTFIILFLFIFLK